MANVYSLTVAADTRQIQQGMVDLKGFGLAADNAAKSTQRIGNLASQVGARDFKGFRAAVEGASLDLRGLAARGRAMPGAFRPMKGAVQQMGFQIGDFATQVAAGQSALIAFSQQGSQLAGIMGPGGAVLGAVIAIGGAIAGGLVRSMGQGEEATESYIEKINDLGVAYEDLTETQRELIRVEAAREQRNRDEEIRALQQSIALRERDLELLEQEASGDLDDAIARRGSTALRNIERDAPEAERAISDVQFQIDLLRQESELAAQELEEMLSGGDSSDADKRASSVERMVESLQEEAEALDETNKQTAMRRALFQGATTDQLRAIAVAYDRIEAHEAEQEAAKAAAKAEEQSQKDRMEAIKQYSDLRLSMIDDEGERREEELSRQFSNEMSLLDRLYADGIIPKEEEYLRRRNELRRQYDEELAGIQRNSNQVQVDLFNDGWDASLSIIGGALGDAAQLAKEGGKEAFESYKNFAAAQAAVSGALAFASVLGEATIPIAARLPLAFTVAGLAAEQVNAIQDQEYSGARKDGGSMSAGRDYLVGENGPEIVRMGASGYAVPNHATENMQGKGNQTTVVFNMSAGVQGTVRSEIFAMMPIIEQRTTQAVAKGISEGGTLSRAVGRRT